MNCLFKLISFFVLLIVFIVGLGFLAQFAFNKYAPTAICEWASETTGFGFEMDYLKLDALNSSFSIKAFEISNPQSWEDSDFFSLDEATCDFSVKNSTKERLYFDRLALDLDEMALVIDENGNANWTELAKKFKEEAAQVNGTSEPEEETPKEDDSVAEDKGEGTQLPAIFVKELVLGLDKIEIVDYSRSPAWKRTYEVGMHIELQDVDNVDDLIAPVIQKLIESGATSAIPVIYDALGKEDGMPKGQPNPLQLLNGLLGQ